MMYCGFTHTGNYIASLRCTQYDIELLKDRVSTVFELYKKTDPYVLPECK